MKKLRSFAYLDTDKLYSLSSQIFEGLTEWILKSSQNQNTESEEQLGPKHSGRVLADIAQSATGLAEKKFMHDYSYGLFEDAIIAQNRVLGIDAESISRINGEISNFNFVRVTGRAIFSDLKVIEELIMNFNSLGESLGYLSMKDEYNALVEPLKGAIAGIKDRNGKAKAQGLAKGINFNTFLKERGLQLDPEQVKHMLNTLRYAYNGQFEVQIPIYDGSNKFVFSSTLQRKHFKEEAEMLIRKYARESERPFVLFGIVTQHRDGLEKKEVENVANDASMKSAMKKMIRAVANMENSFSGKLDGEIVIDPISLYAEL